MPQLTKTLTILIFGAGSLTMLNCGKNSGLNLPVSKYST
jgi:hypothetical protein